MYVLFNLYIFIFPPIWGYIVQQKFILKYTIWGVLAYTVYLWKVILKYLTFVWGWALSSSYCNNAEKRGQTPGTSALPAAVRAWAQGVPGRPLAVLKHLFCLLTAKLSFSPFHLSESSDHNIQLSKCSLFVNAHIKSQPVLGVLHNVPIKEFYHPLNFHSVLTQVCSCCFKRSTRYFPRQQWTHGIISIEHS